MNEVTKIHLGRQAFTIAADAYTLLQDYLHAIGRQAGGKDVVEEVELRMAELLTERGVTGDKVILVKDVDYLKEQLGEPGDFSDDGDKAEPGDESSAPKRLFRDTEHAMLAGVCAGIGKYFGIDPLWIRLLFVILVLAGASGILIYILLWLIVPAAKTSSERLQMQGKHVTVDTLKEVVERADVKGAAKRATNVVGGVVNTALKVVLEVTGLVLMAAAISTLLGVATASIYWGLNPDFVPGDIFPVGVRETVLICAVMLFAAMLSAFLLVGGLAMVKRKWPLPGWAVGSMVAVTLASLAVGGALAADAVPKVRERYEASKRTYVRSLPEFSKLAVVDTVNIGITYEESAEPAVLINYWGDVDVAKLKTSVKDQTLVVDTRELAKSVRCEEICIFQLPILSITIRGPKLNHVVADMHYQELQLGGLENQSLTIETVNDSVVHLPGMVGDTVKVRQADGAWTVSVAGSYSSVVAPQQFFAFASNASLSNARDIELQFEKPCPNQNESSIFIDSTFKHLLINGRSFTSLRELKQAQLENPNSYLSCVDFDPFLPGEPILYEPAATDSL